MGSSATRSCSLKMQIALTTGYAVAVKFVQTGVVTPYARVCGKRPRLHKLHSHPSSPTLRACNGGATNGQQHLPPVHLSLPFEEGFRLAHGGCGEPGEAVHAAPNASLVLHLCNCLKGRDPALSGRILQLAPPVLRSRVDPRHALPADAENLTDSRRGDSVGLQCDHQPTQLVPLR